MKNWKIGDKAQVDGHLVIVKGTPRRIPGGTCIAVQVDAPGAYLYGYQWDANLDYLEERVDTKSRIDWITAAMTLDTRVQTYMINYVKKTGNALAAQTHRNLDWHISKIKEIGGKSLLKALKDQRIQEVN